MPPSRCGEVMMMVMLLSQICTDGTSCKRRVCFFAHLESEVRKREEPPLNGTMQAEVSAGKACLGLLVQEMT